MKHLNLFLILLFFQIFGQLLVAQEFEEIPKQVDVKPVYIEAPLWEISVGTGFGYRMEPIADQTTIDTRNYLTGMKTALLMGIEGNYYVKENLGVGLTYSLFHVNDQVESGRLNIAENMSTHYIGPTLTIRDGDGLGKWFYGPRIGLGYVYYENDTRVKDGKDYKDFTDIENRGHSLAVLLGYSATRVVAKNFGFGMGGRVLLGLWGTEENYWQSGAQKEGFSRFELYFKVSFLNVKSTQIIN